MAERADVTVNGQQLTSRQVWFLGNAVVAFSRQLQTIKECNLTEDVAADICLGVGRDLEALLRLLPSKID